MAESTSPKILVVDDEEIIRIGCQRILEDSTFQVDLAENGRVARDTGSAPDACPLAGCGETGPIPVR